MSYPVYMSKDNFNKHAFNIFVNFVVRKGVLDAAQVREEVEIMKDAGIDLTSDMSVKEREKRYLTKQRIGASFGLDRVKRIELLLTLENAINHATFDDELTNPDSPYHNFTRKFKEGV